MWYDSLCNRFVKSSGAWDMAPLWCGPKRHMGRVPFPLVDREIKCGDKEYQCTTMTQAKVLLLLNTEWSILGLGGKLSQHTIFNLVLLIDIFRSFMIIHWDKCHGTLLVNLIISPHFSGNGLGPSCKNPESAITKISDVKWCDKATMRLSSE